MSRAPGGYSSNGLPPRHEPILSNSQLNETSFDSALGEWAIGSCIACDPVSLAWVAAGSRPASARRSQFVWKSARGNERSTLDVPRTGPRSVSPPVSCPKIASRTRAVRCGAPATNGVFAAPLVVGELVDELGAVSAEAP